jgi:hypothetical protein
MKAAAKPRPNIKAYLNMRENPRAMGAEARDHARERDSRQSWQQMRL